MVLTNVVLLIDEMMDDVSWDVLDLIYDENVVDVRVNDDLLYGDMGDVLFALNRILL